MIIARVFPTRTRATPVDPLAFYGPPPFLLPSIDEVHISVTFTWDLPDLPWLVKQWEHVAPVKTGGPALEQPAGEFIPGRYLKPGYTITSRGCPNRCWFCRVWHTEPVLKHLPICPGWNVLDDNLLASHETHVRAVFRMLKDFPRRKVEFTGGLEAKLLEDWHVLCLKDISPDQVFFAYDTPDDLDPLKRAAVMMYNAGFTRQRLRAYALCGYAGDTFAAATCRMKEILATGMYPMAMVYVTPEGKKDLAWGEFQNNWARPARIATRIKKGLV